MILAITLGYLVIASYCWGVGKSIIAVLEFIESSKKKNHNNPM